MNEFKSMMQMGLRMLNNEMDGWPEERKTGAHAMLLYLARGEGYTIRKHINAAGGMEVSYTLEEMPETDAL